MHPYENLDEKYFWSAAVAKKNMFDIEGLWNPKFAIRKRDRVVTFGSCFAQHIGRAMAARGYNWVDTEPAPESLSPENAKKFNYGIFSSRTGNIYTVSLLKQWTAWALGKANAPDEIWEDKGRFYDPFRPVVEPGGFASREELLRSRQHTIQAFRKGIESASVFVFTLGLTESWRNDADDFEYPMCPGTAAGTFNAAQHKFHNQRYPHIRKELMAAMDLMREVNPGIRFLLTVSPVPLTATMSGNHVLVATMESKSVLRAVAGHLAGTLDDVDYFPSYEIINATPYRGTFFEANQRNVNHAGVNHVMDSFFACLNATFPEQQPAAAEPRRRGKQRAARDDAEAESETEAGSTSPAGNDDVVCEEALLGAFVKSEALREINRVKKICVIGNSHIASLKLGWDHIRPSFPDVGLTFFGARARSMDALRVKGDALVAGDKDLARSLEVTSGGLSRIVPADYDLFLLYGLDFIIPRLESHLSQAVRIACLQDAYSACLNGHVAARLRRISQQPVYVGHNPQLADGASAEDGVSYDALFANPCRVGAAKDMTVVRQPQSTLAEGWSTRPEFAEGSVRLDVGKGSPEVKHPDGEVKHMNGQFGELYLREFLAALN